VVVEELSPGEWEQREVYAKFGVAVYLCQCLESQLVNYVIALRGVAGNAITRQEVDVLFGELFGNTLGRNLREAARVLGDDAALSSELAPVLTLRNELVHHWMRERALDQGTSKKRRAMIEELDTAIEQLEVADATLVERTQPLLERLGVSRSIIHTEYERLREVAASDNAENVMQDVEVVTKARRS
jgi:hypothetical protein